jgi:hypothetical protein
MGARPPLLQFTSPRLWSASGTRERATAPSGTKAVLLLPLPVLYGAETSKARSERVGVRGSIRTFGLAESPLTLTLSPQAVRGKDLRRL